MKKSLIFFVVLVLINLQLHSQNISQISFKTLSGDTVLLSSLLGKKTLFFIVPLNQNDPHFSQLQAFKNRYGDTVRIVGIPSIEDGFITSGSSSLQNLYGSMGIQLSEGMYTKKSSGTNQSSLMKWLTNKNQNLHFDMDASGIGHKFFVSESGRLFAVMPSQARLGSPIIDRIVHSTSQ
jgi:glutathione peroxidase-family protein